MKRYRRYISSANRLTNAITQRISKKFDENEILVRALAGKHDGEPMMYVFFNIMLDPNVQIENPRQLEGNHTIFYNGKNIGWINFERGMGWIDDRAYDKIEKIDPALLDQLLDQYLSQMMGLAGQVDPNALPGGANDRLEYGDDDEDFGGYY